MTQNNSSIRKNNLTQSHRSDPTLSDALNEIVVAHVGLEPIKNNEAIQQELQRILFEPSDDTIRKWGNSEKWVLELRDGRKAVVPIQISLPPSSAIDLFDEKL